MKPTRTDILLAEVRSCLEQNILPYWLTLADPKGGFQGEVLSDGTVLPDAPRGAILNARILWAFSAAYQALHKSEYLVAAMHAKEWFIRNFCDHKHGGVYWSVGPDGRRLDDKAQLYAQGFAIYGLSEFYKVTRDDQALKAAVNIFRIVEKYFHDEVNGGYIEALSRDFSPLEDMSLSAHDINADKTMNSHLHILEAYANLYKVWPMPELRQRIVELLDIVGRRVMGPDGHLQLYFRRDWSVIPGAVSYGHDIETSWLALECAMAVGDIDVVTSVRPWARRLGLAGNEGLLPDGSMRYEKLLDGSFDDSRQWWVEAEAVVGNLWLWKYHGDDAAADRAFALWAWIRDHLLRPDGEWQWAILPSGEPDLSQPKAGFWKCPYHNTRMCLEILRLL